MKKSFQRTGRLEEVLVDFDGAQVILIFSAKRPLIGVAIPSYKGLEYPFFCCAVKDKSFKKYFDGTADLRYVFRTAFRQKYFIVDLADDAESLRLFSASKLEVENQDYWPDSGFFSRTHTSDYNTGAAPTAVQTYHIDGQWGATDFATFNNKVADLYAICDVVTSANDNDETLLHSIDDNNFSSGGSYLGFYNSLKHSSNRLQIKELRYASPGVIKLGGNKVALEEVADILSRFENDYENLRLGNSDLQKILKSEKLLGEDADASFSTPEIEALALKYANILYSDLGFENADWLFSHCRQNTLVFSKIVRSIYSRASRIWSYKLEGRLQEVEFS